MKTLAIVAAILTMTACAPIGDNPAPMPGSDECATCEQMLEPGRVGFFDICRDEFEAFIEMEKCRIEQCIEACPHADREQGIDCSYCYAISCPSAYSACLWPDQEGE